MTSQNETTSLSPTESIEELCSYPPAPMLEVRFWLVSVFGSTVSVISIVENIFLFLLFATRKRHRKENVYMMLLAFFDIFVSIAYVMLMSVNILADYLESPVLIQIWFSYMVPMITISHIAMSSSSFLIVAASFERYCLTLNSRFLRTAQKQRLLIALSAVFLGILSKGTMCLEFQPKAIEQTSY
ncbi:unnamed protein product [Caenorhabditis auriculariae]|uniref:G-protein coupled receptors family 1 profile domain-containing protein n=1 Tax=Caenorhabditis auriculariae TaxID=2777116 RepID=A0A8S1HCL5_9PELO|nr:unnamed protein product [Caenorhabditis auriculariae]